MTKPRVVVAGGNPGDAELLQMALDRHAEACGLATLPDGGEAFAMACGALRPGAIAT